MTSTDTPTRHVMTGFATLLTILLSACGAPPADPSVGATQRADSITRASLVHDIPADHPRIPYFDELVDTVAGSTEGALVIEINPGGELLAGRASLDAVRSGAADLALVNMTHVEAMEPAAGFMNLPFALDDVMMADGRNRTAVWDIQADLVRPHGVELLGYMRGADQLFALPDDGLRRLEDLTGRRIRVAGGGIYGDLMTRLGAEPVAVPIPQIRDLMARGEVDGVFTSPGGWATQVLESAPHGVQVPGLMYISYALVANRRWLDGLPDDQQAAVAAAGERLTGQWTQMAADDRAVVDQAVTGGGTYQVLPGDEVARFRERVTAISAEFYRTHPALSEALTQRGLRTTG